MVQDQNDTNKNNHNGGACFQNKTSVTGGTLEHEQSNTTVEEVLCRGNC